MANNIALLFSVIVILVIPGKIQCKVNGNITFFLTKSETTEIINIDQRTSRLKHPEVSGAERSFMIKAFGNMFIIDLSIFYPREDTEITYISKLWNTSDSFLSSTFLLHQGYVRNVNNSFVLGYFGKEKPFRGYVVTDEVFCIEPHDSNKVIVYRFKDVITPGCMKIAEDKDLDCSETRYFIPWIANKPPIQAYLPDYNLFYDNYLQFFHRLQAKKAEEKKGDGQKNKGKTGDEDCHKNKPCKHHKSDEKDKNKKTVAKKSAFYFREDDDISKAPNSENKIVHPVMNKASNASEKRRDKQDKKNKEDDDEEGGNKYNDDKVLKDDDRFPHTESDFAHQIHLTDINATLSEIFRLDTNDSGTIMNHFYNNKEPLPMWKESVFEDIENYQKQAVKREEKLSNKEPIAEALKSDHIESLQCDVQVVVAPSLLEKFDNDIEMLIKDIFIQFTLMNKIFLKVPLRWNDTTIHFFLHIRQIVIHADQVYSPFTGRADLEYFTKTNRLSQDYCLRIGLVNQFLRSGDFFDGYTPEGKGGICSKVGKTLIASHGNERSPTPMALYFAALIRGVTRAMGALDKDDECAKGSFPNPMQILQNYLLTEEIAHDPGYSIFTTCNVKEIKKAFDRQKCLRGVSQPLCGNAILDPNEECDCGPVVFCRSTDPCCNPPHLLLDPEPSELKSGSAHKGCTLIKNAKCSALQECCDACQISKLKSVCYSGPGDCDIAMCDGKSASCPTTVEASNGMICFANESLAEPFVCKDKKCDQLLCSSFGLEPCSCAVGTGKDCVYCCMKDGKCQAAGTGLNLFPDRNFYFPDGTECMGGSCQDGSCVEFEGSNILKKPPRFSTTSDGCKEFSALYIITASIFSISVLLLLQSVP